MRKFYMAMACMFGMLLAMCLMAPVHASPFHHPYGGWHGGYHHDYHGWNRWDRGLLVGALVGDIVYESTRPRVNVIVNDQYYDPNYVTPSWRIVYVQEYDPQCACDVTVKRYIDRWGNIR